MTGTTDLTSLALNWVATYGAPMVAVLLLVGSLGVPLPGTLLVVACGAFIRQDLLDLTTTPLFGYAGTITGDLLLFAAGALFSRRIQARFGQTPAWASAHGFFTRRGGLAVFLTRWLVTALAFPVTLIAGSSGYRLRSFLFFDLLGELTWIGLYGGLGYYFGSQWELISDFISNSSSFLLGALAVGAGVSIAVRYLRRDKVVRARPVEE